MVALFAQQSNIIDFSPSETVQNRSNEWYTPSIYIEAARKIMGGIDLDPASCELANQTVRASRYYSKEDNGLTKPWYGRVWLNPPFSKDMTQSNDKRSTIHKWISVCVERYLSGDIEQATILTTTRTDTPWFNLLWNYPVCFANHVVSFNVPYATTRWSVSHIHGTCFAYLGPNEQKFIDIFSQFGRIARAIDTPSQKPITLSLWDGLDMGNSDNSSSDTSSGPSGGNSDSGDTDTEGSQKSVVARYTRRIDTRSPGKHWSPAAMVVER